MSTTEHWDDPRRRQPMADPRPGSRVDDHAARIRAAQLARSIHTEGTLAGSTTESHRYFPVDGVTQVVRRDMFGRLYIDSVGGNHAWCSRQLVGPAPRGVGAGW